MQTDNYMQALVLTQFNQPLQIQTLPRPIAGKGQVLVHIHASGINPLDLKIQAGTAAHAQVQTPAVPGIDMAGVVVQVGEGVTAFAPGDEVYGMVGGVGTLQGTLAQYVAADADLLAIKPKSLSMREAAALPLVFITAWEGLIEKAHIQKGETVLIHGGNGGVGHVAIQIARHYGAQVFATGAAAHHDYIRSLGATPINYTQEETENYVNRHTQGEGFDVVLDTIGGPVLDASFKAVKMYSGRVVSILGWGSHSLAPLSFKSATYAGVFTLYPMLSGKGRARQGAILREASAMADAGILHPLLDERQFIPATIQDAYEAIRNKTAAGKLVATVRFE